MKLKPAAIFFFFISTFANLFCAAQDTLRVMTYNVLHYGDRCQGSNSSLHANLKTIVHYEKPDVLGLVKVQSIKISTTDLAGISQVGFADSILVNAMNAANGNIYDHCPVVNFSGDPDDDMDLLFYNSTKLSFLSVVNLCTTQEDFNLYKLYYKDPNLSKTKDTTFLYFILNHTVSGTDETGRDTQDSTIVKNLKRRFSHLPNLISMGDFNTHSSYEAGYQLLTESPDSSFIFNDPPFSPDHLVNYPATWGTNSGLFARFLNTSTRESTLPNSCGTMGGAKDWYLHILLSPWVVKNSNYVKYIPQSYTTVGNDGMRSGVSINDSSRTKNTSAPAGELNALYQFSDKYPIKIKLLMTPNISGVSPMDPDLPPEQMVMAVKPDDGSLITVSNPVGSKVTFNFPPTMTGGVAVFQWNDLLGRTIQSGAFTITSRNLSEDVQIVPGFYILRIQVSDVQYAFRMIKE